LGRGGGEYITENYVVFGKEAEEKKLDKCLKEWV